MANSNRKASQSYTIIKGFSDASMKFARSCFSRGLNATQTLAAMKGRGYGKLPSIQAVAWGLIAYNKEKGLNRSRARRKSSSTSTSVKSRKTTTARSTRRSPAKSRTARKSNRSSR